MGPEEFQSFWRQPRQGHDLGRVRRCRMVGYHLIAYGGRDDGLFRGAIMESDSSIR